MSRFVRFKRIAVSQRRLVQKYEVGRVTRSNSDGTVDVELLDGETMFFGITYVEEITAAAYFKEMLRYKVT